MERERCKDVPGLDGAEGDGGRPACCGEVPRCRPPDKGRPEN
jgi:hypothetical protein